MKHIVILFLSILTVSAYGQDKYNYLYSGRLMELKGTEYVVSKVENWGKMLAVKSQYLLFVNTENGQMKRVDFPKDASLHHVEQIKIDSLQINKVLVTAKTVNLDNNKHIDWDDPTQILVVSPDGKDVVQLTDDNFFARDWVINNKTGNILITGHFDSNNNGKYDKADVYKILLYSLRNLKLVAEVQQ
ncbi:hypothetical protein [Chitinophaga filiformis]|uniref:Uncharacterized protein n=1 Tax=Chitinophaga filiformis TaxID=104663 RepID=A0ABY4HVZ0_CHIFI|nr:hypothetical protein [Chitinophaga filiformis]UPK67633.1 hypothetical protein MYF79_22050 [Chitinophaga filiformis]